MNNTAISCENKFDYNHLERDVIFMTESLTTAVAADRANCSSVARLTYDHHECNAACEVQTINVWYNVNRHVLVELFFGQQKIQVHNCQGMDKGNKLDFQSLKFSKMQNTYACAISGKLHVCTHTHCNLYKCGSCVTEDGAYACPLTGIVHSYDDCFARHWSCDANINSTPDAYAAKQASVFKLKNTVCHVKSKVLKVSQFIQNATNLMKELLPNGIIHKHVQSKINSAKVRNCSALVCKYIRKIKRNVCTQKSVAFNLHQMKALVYTTLFQNNVAPINDICTEKRMLYNICKHYVVSINNLYNTVNKNIVKQKGKCQRDLKHSSFSSFLISMLYLCKSGLKNEDRVILVKDELLDTLLPSLHHIIRISTCDASINNIAQIMYPAKMKHLTKYMVLTKSMLCNKNLNIANFCVNYKHIINGNSQLTIETSTSEIKRTTIV